MTSRRERRREEQRVRILEAARGLFSVRGAEDVTMAEVAGEAGVSRATVFNHFGTKHALIEGITEDVLARYHGLLTAALEDRGTATADLVRGLFADMGHGIEHDRRFHRAVFREIAKLSLGLDEGGPGQRARQANVAMLVQLLCRGQARGELEPRHRPEDLATAFDSLVYGTVTHWLYDDASEPLQKRMERVAELFLDRVALAPDRPHAPEATRRRSAASARGAKPAGRKGGRRR